MHRALDKAANEASSNADIKVRQLHQLLYICVCGFPVTHTVYHTAMSAPGCIQFTYPGGSSNEGH